MRFSVRRKHSQSSIRQSGQAAAQNFASPYDEGDAFVIGGGKRGLHPSAEPSGGQAGLRVEAETSLKKATPK